MGKDDLKLHPEGMYHIYNRSNGGLKIFYNEENRAFFLEKYLQFISPVARTFAFCIMPDHFHFLIRIKDASDLEKPPIEGEDEIDASLRISLSFSKLFNSYAKAFNYQEGRHGSVFSRPFKRKRIDRISYLKKLIHYIHLNPVEAGLCSFPGEWPFSSYNEVLLKRGRIVECEEVLKLFHDRENFLKVHKEKTLR